MPILIDAHEDLAYLSITYGRDITRPAAETRAREQGSAVLEWNHGHTVLGWPDYQRGQVALVFGTLFAPPARMMEGAWDRLGYRNPLEAVRSYRANLDYYLRLAGNHPDKFRLVSTRKDLDEVLEAWKTAPGVVPVDENDQGPGPSRPSQGSREPDMPNPEEDPVPGTPVGIVLSMEGAEAIREPAEAEEWWEAGVRLIGPAWMNGNAYCGGNREPGPLTRAGRELLDTMAGLGFGLDLTHMAHEAIYQALDVYPGTVIASHSNPGALLKDSQNERFLSDRILSEIVEHDGVVGIAPFNAFLIPGWNRSLSNAKERVSLQDLAAHIDYVCQIAGDARHVALGTDFDGGFGLPDVPAEIDTIADLQKLDPVLREKGYNSEDIAAIFSGNWVSILQRILP